MLWRIVRIDDLKICASFWKRFSSAIFKNKSRWVLLINSLDLLKKFVKAKLLFSAYKIKVNGKNELENSKQAFPQIDANWHNKYRHKKTQIDANCSLFKSLNMLPFHIRLERLKLIYYGLILNFSNFYFKTATLFLLFLSSYIPLSPQRYLPL